MAVTHRRARWLAGLAAASLLATALTGTASAAPQASAPGAGDKPAHIDAKVAKKVDNGGRASFWVHFDDRPDLSKFESIDDWDSRGEAVYKALVKTAKTSQADVRAELKAAHVSFKTFYISNAIKVSGGDESLVETLAAADGVDRIIAPFKVEAPDDKLTKAKHATTQDVEWGVHDIHADQVWSDYGATGQGIVVANIDTGVQFDHPALVSHYRGNNGDGTFDHDYNWMNFQGSPDAPADGNGHGTHTMGTMVGDDGSGNQIGVAPGAKWIAVNGCCPDDEALLSSMEWMLAPTNLKGENPDPSKRPNIVNNSWGTTNPSNDPFGEEIQAAWNASGVFGVFSNGNEGSGCNTTGSPGSRTLNYSVGNYTSEHGIAVSSSRGAGQDGEIKPNISAPGTNIRSSVPGGGYALYTGTSMAAPHVAGTVALLWSAAPALVGDIDATRTLLDGTAEDTEDLQCGGTAADNNVFGEGRLDALAAIQAAPLDRAGTIKGTVEDASTGEPIERATVKLDGEQDRTLTTNAQGEYTAMVVPGDYDVEAKAFTYASDNATVTVENGGETEQDFSLESVESETVTGTVTDGSGQGWPLYAAIKVDGTPITTFTDPTTGEYSFEAPVGETFEVSATAQYPGYTAVTHEVTVDGATTADFSVPVDATTCTAAGYHYASDPKVEEHFDDTTLPKGWEVTDESGSGNTWAFDNPGSRKNLTRGGEGNFVTADAQTLGAMDTALVTPSLDLSEVSDPTLTFHHYYNLIWEPAPVAAVDVSVDDGSTWTNLATYSEQNIWGAVTIPLPMAVGESDVRVRFHYDSNGSDPLWYWQVDDIVVADRPCAPIDGGLVLGNVRSDGAGLPGAVVTNRDDATQRAVSAATVADENLDDGFYWLFSGPGTHEYKAAARRYESTTQPVTVVDHGVVRADFDLVAGNVVVTEKSIDADLPLGESTTKDLTITNQGKAAAKVDLQEVPGSFTLQRADGTRSSLKSMSSAKGAPRIERKGETSIAEAPKLGTTSQAPAEMTPSAAPWLDLAPLLRPTMDNRVVSLDGSLYTIGGSSGSPLASVERYDNEAMAWKSVASMPTPASAMSAGVIDGKIFVSGGWAGGSTTTATYAYDPEANTWTTVADAPFGVSAAGYAVADGKLYVVAGCTTSDCEPMGSKVAAYDADTNTWQELADYPMAAAFVSCGGLGDDVYCTGGNTGSDGTAKTYVYDARADLWQEVATAPVTLWGSNATAANGQLIVNGGSQNGSVSNRSFAYQPATDEWKDLPNSNHAVYRAGAACGFAVVGGALTGFSRVDNTQLLPGYEQCGSAGDGVSWMDLSERELTLAPGESATVKVSLDADVAQPGDYTATIRVGSDTPDTPEVPVSMTVQPPTYWGKLQGSVAGTTCAGDSSPLAGAGVDIAPTRGGHPGWFLSTGDDGSYATWFDTRVGKSNVTATKDGYRPKTAAVTVPRGQTVTQEFALRDASCQEEPEPIHPDVVRLSGSDQYRTAAKISGLFEPGVDTVFVATGERYPEAVAAAARAGSVDAPVLLTRKATLPDSTADELARLEPANVVVIGNSKSISAKVVHAIEDSATDADVDRLYGKNSYATAAAIAEEFRSAETVYVATGTGALDGGSLAVAARAGALDGPVLFVKKSDVPKATARALERLDPTDIKVLGGAGVVSKRVLRDLGDFGAVERIPGATAVEAAVSIAKDYATSGSVFVASGQSWSDGLTAAAPAGAQEAPVLLTHADSIPDATWDELERLKPGTVYVLGDTASVSPEVFDQLGTLE